MATTPNNTWAKSGSGLGNAAQCWGQLGDARQEVWPARGARVGGEGHPGGGAARAGLREFPGPDLGSPDRYRAASNCRSMQAGALGGRFHSRAAGGTGGGGVSFRISTVPASILPPNWTPDADSAPAATPRGAPLGLRPVLGGSNNSTSRDNLFQRSHPVFRRPPSGNRFSALPSQPTAPLLARKPKKISRRKRGREGARSLLARLVGGHLAPTPDSLRPGSQGRLDFR